MGQDWKTLTEGLFFIIGTGRCGTTLFQSMLSSHSRIAVLPETGFFWKFDPLIHFSDPLAESQMEAYIRSCTENWWWQDLGLDSEAFADAVQEGMRSSQEIFLWILGQLSGRSGKVKIGDNTSVYGMKAVRMFELFPEAKFIHLYRDPRDVVSSLLSQYWWKPNSTMRAAIYCREFLEYAKKLQQRLSSDRFLAVQYESLVKQPERELQRTCAFLGEKFEPNMLRFYERSERGFVEIEGDWKNLTLTPLTEARQQIYRQRLTTRQIRTVEFTLGKLLGEYGYKPDPQVPDYFNWRIEDLIERIIWELKRLWDKNNEDLIDEQSILKKRAENRNY